MTATVIVIAKAPVPGRVKTRLTPPLSPTQAAALARAALEDTLAAVAAARLAGRRVVALDGDPDGWLPDGFELVAQRGGGLAQRLARAFEDVGGPALLIGMDTPQITPGPARRRARAPGGRRRCRLRRRERMAATGRSVSRAPTRVSSTASR